MDPTKVAVVTGANRGIGLEVCRQLAEAGWRVVLTARDEGAGQAAADRLGGAVIFHRLDVTLQEDADNLARWVGDTFGRIDALVNNAGVIAALDSPNTLTVPALAVDETLATNAVGAFRVAQAFIPLLAEGEGGNLVNVSSGMGALNDMGGGWPAYRMSKAAINAMTVVMHRAVHGLGVRVNAVCPGWVRTDMGGAGATRSVPVGARGVVWAATLGPDGPSGGFFRDGEPIDW